jgi:drug/metabolite transporter (DMT)-like permease
MQTQYVIFSLLAIFIAYRIIMRVRRTIGWQKLQPRKMRVMATIFGIIGMIFLVEGAFHSISLMSDVIGIVAGVILAYYGASLTRYEQREGDWYYRPNNWIGGIVTVLFFGRLIYRIYGLATMPAFGGSGGNLSSMDAMRTMATGWTSGLLLVMFSYYVIYYLLLLNKRKHFA